jgi:hypothetical protein
LSKYAIIIIIIIIMTKNLSSGKSKKDCYRKTPKREVRETQMCKEHRQYNEKYT